MPIIDHVLASGISPQASNVICGGFSTITAAGNSLATGTLISTANCLISIVSSSGKSATLPQCGPSSSIDIYNGGANTANIYPPTSSEIFNAASAGALFTLASHKTATFTKFSSTQWGVTLTA